MSLSLPKFQIAILCALNTEYTAICNQLDQNLADCGVVIARSASDRNAYTAGVIRGHPIIVARIQDTGKSAAALTAANLSATHKGIKLCILMGICAGAPRNAENQPIFLGDVIISTHVYNSDHGRLRDTGLERYKEDIQQLSRLERGIKALVDKCSNDYDKPRIEEEVNNRVDRSMQDSKLPARYKYPGVTEDRLFRPTHPHRHWEQESKCKHCAVDVHSSCRFASGISCVELGCGKIRNALVSRMRRPGRGAVELLDSLRSENLRPSIQLHFGPLSSADHVLRSSTLRDQQNILDEVIGYEMEAAGIWDCLPTIVIKGVSDYADAHKNKEFQGYAAVTSAATVHTVLQHWHLDSEAACTSKMHAKMVRSGQKGYNKIRLNEIVHRHEFLGRTNEMHELSKRFCHPDRRLVCEKLVLLGPPGVGKSALYENWYAENKDHYWAWWIINCTSQTEINQGFHEILSSSDDHMLKSEAQSHLKTDASVLHSLVVKWIRSQMNPWFLILDNANNGPLVAHNFKDLLNAASGSVIIVTCDKQIERELPGMEFLTLRPLPVNLAVSMLQSHIVRLTEKGVVNPKESFEQLVQELGCLPEAIILVARYLCLDETLQFSHPSLTSRAEAYRQSYGEPGNLEAKSVLGPIWGLFKNLLMQLGSDEASDALSLLYLLTFFSTSGIPVALLFRAMKNSHRYAEKSSVDVHDNPSDSESAHWTSLWGYGPKIIKWLQYSTSHLYQQPAPLGVAERPIIPWLDNPDESLPEKEKMLNKSLSLLLRCHLIEYSESSQLIFVKQWIRRCALDSMNKGNSLLRTYALRSLVMISQAIDGKYDAESKLFRRSLFSQIVAHKDAYPDRQCLLNDLRARDALILSMGVSLVYFESGQIGSAKEIQAAAVERAGASLPSDDDLLLRAQSQLAASLFSLDGYQDRDCATGLREDVMKRRQTLCNSKTDLPSWRAYIGSLSDLADSYDHISAKTLEAVAYRKEVLKAHMSRGKYGYEELLEAKQRLARSYYCSGQRKQALQLRTRVFAQLTGLDIELFSIENLEKNPDEFYLSILSDLADSLCSFGRWNQAMQMRKFVLQVRDRVLGSGHYDTIVAKANLSISLTKMRQNESAIKLRVEIFELYRSVFGFKHAVTLKAYCDLGQIEAEVNPLKGYAIQREALGQWNCLYSKAESYSAERTDRIAQMASSLERVMRKFPTLEVFPAYPYLPAGVRILDEAVRLRKGIYESKRAQFDEDDPEVLYAKSMLADCYMAGGRSMQAYELREGLLERWRARIGGLHNPATDIKYLGALRAWARNCDLLVAFWAPMRKEIYRWSAPSAAQAPTSDNKEDPEARALTLDRSSNDSQITQSSDARSGYGEEHIEKRSGYVRQAQEAWRQLLDLHLSVSGDEWSYEVLRIKRDLGDSLMQYAGETAEESISQFKEANKLWKEAWSTLAQPGRLGPDHPEVLDLAERLRKFTPTKKAMVEDGIESSASFILPMPRRHSVA